MSASIDTHRISRRDLVRGAAAGVAALALGVRRATAGPPARPPNIVFILADDLGYADVACYGRPDVRTPSIDHLAATGVRFLQAYANSAVCSATRVALITGRYQYRLRLGLEEPLAGAVNADVGLDPTHPTLPSLLRTAGYGTTLVGKWHLGALPRYGPLQSGYDGFYGYRGGAVDYYSHANPAGKADLWEGDVPVERAGYLTELLGDRAVEVVRGYARARRPFLLSLHFSAPHWPWEAPGDTAESARLRTVPGGLFHLDGGSQQTYRRMIEAMDHQIGRVLGALRAGGLSDNTIVIFTSDNGGERFADTWPFTGRKTELLEGGLRIPSIISWPGRIPRGRTSDQVSISMDWLPTLQAAAGAEPDPAYPSDGMSLLPHLTQGAGPVPRTLYWRYKARAQRAVRDGDLKFLKILDHTFLFDVVADPLERANLKARRPDDYRRLVRQWLAWNATMLPEVGGSFTHGFSGEDLADHYGSGEPDSMPDIPSPADSAP
jgi:arylsulfatase A-like enzyme